MHFLTQPPVRPDPNAIAEEQNLDHQFWIDRGAACLVAEWPQLFPDAIEIDNPVYRPQQMAMGNMVFQAEALKQRLLPHCPIIHHKLVSQRQGHGIRTVQSTQGRIFNTFDPYWPFGS